LTLTTSEFLALEETLTLHIREAEAATVRVVDTTGETRQEAYDLLKEPGQPDVSERLDRLRLFQKLLTNLRLNSDLFTRSILELRVNQLRAVQNLAAFLAREGDGKSSGYFRQPTGAGKTVLFGIIARLLSVRTLVLVPRTNLIDQTVKEFTDVVGFSPDSIGRVGAGTIELERPITIATYQSHLSRMNSDPAYRSWVSDCELVICDEAHRSLGTQTAKSIDALDEEEEEKDEEDSDGEFDNIMTAEEEEEENAAITSLIQSKTKALKLGFTATPRLAQKNVEERFGTCIACETHADMVAAQILVPYRLVSVDGTVTDFDLEGTFTEEKEAAVLHRNRTYQTLVNEYATVLRAYQEKTTEIPYPMRGVAFCVNIAECDAFAKETEAIGMRARVVTGREAKGGKGDDVIREAEQQLIRGEIDLIITVAKLGEGWNFPPANAAIWARAALSEAPVIQGIGRTARAHFDTATRMRKPFAYVFETRWSLQNGNSRKRTRRPLSIADALSRNGEDPTLICQNADSSPLTYARPITPEELSSLIQEHYTPDTWSKLPLKDRSGRNFAGTGLGIIAIARLFGIEGNPTTSTSVRDALGLAIWPDTYGDRESRERERVRGLLTTTYAPDTWAKLSQKDRIGRNFAGTGLGLRSIGRLFSIEGNPTSTNSVRDALGLAIWPDTYVVSKTPDCEHVRSLLATVYTPDTWAQLSKLDRSGKNFAGTGLGIIAIARLFGVEGNPLNNTLVHDALGFAIWPDTYENKESKERERVRGLLTTTYAPDTWAKLSQKDRIGRNFASTGLGLTAIARLFGVEGDPQYHSSVHDALGFAIWPDTYGDRESMERERVRSLFTKAYTPDMWAKLSKIDRFGKNFAGTGLSLYAIAHLFGIEGNPVKNSSVRDALGFAIWPDTYGDRESMERERVRSLFTKAYTPDTWAKLSQEDRSGRNYAGTGLGLVAIARIFGIEGDPVFINSVRDALGRAIWPDTYGDREEMERKRVRSILTAMYTPDAWSKLSLKNRSGRNFAGTGLGLYAITHLFGVKGDPVSYNSIHDALGFAIWPDTYGGREEMERERVHRLLTDTYTPDTWAKLSQKDRTGRNFAGTGLGLIAIARLFGVEGNPLANKSVHDALGRAIWKDQWKEAD